MYLENSSSPSVSGFSEVSIKMTLAAEEKKRHRPIYKKPVSKQDIPLMFFE